MHIIVLYWLGVGKDWKVFAYPWLFCFHVHRYFFWTDWGENPRIERASMDGRERTVLHSLHLAWPNGLTIDYATHTLYWIDAKVLTIESSFIDGSNRRPIRTVDLRHPFALTMFENRLYWSDWQRKSIYTTPKFARSFNRLDGLSFNETLGYVDFTRENRTYTEVRRESTSMKDCVKRK